MGIFNVIGSIIIALEFIMKPDTLLGIALTILYNIWGDWENAYKHSQLSYSPGFHLYEYSAMISSYGKNSIEEAKQHAENLKLSLESDKLSDVKIFLEGMNLKTRYYPIAEKMLKEFNFQ